MNVLIVGAMDTGGQGIRLKQAFDRHAPGWTVRSMAKARQYMAYADDLPYNRHRLEELYQWCDVIHVRNKFDLYDSLVSKFGPKSVIIHFHGTLFRSDPNRFLREMKARGALGIVSTLDLYLIAPDELEWLPAPYDVDALAAMA